MNGLWFSAGVIAGVILGAGAAVLVLRQAVGWIKRQVKWMREWESLSTAPAPQPRESGHLPWQDGLPREWPKPLHPRDTDHLVDLPLRRAYPPPETVGRHRPEVVATRAIAALPWQPFRVEATAEDEHRPGVGMDAYVRVGVR